MNLTVSFIDVYIYFCNLKNSKDNEVTVSCAINTF